MTLEAASVAVSPARAADGVRRVTWVPSRWLVAASLVPAIVALAAIVVRPIAWASLVVDVALLALAWLQWRSLPVAALAVDREVPDVLAVGRPNRVVLRIKNRTGLALVVRLADDLIDHATAEGLPDRFELAPHGQKTLHYDLRPQRRGAFELGDHTVRYTRRGCLFWRQERLAAMDPVRVYPDVLAVRQYDTWARQGIERLPGTARTRGGESEFARLRPYSRDDEFRHIDWRATARRRELTVREFQTETQQSVFVMLDAGRAMRAEAEGLSFLDHALNATLMLGHVALVRGDQVGLLAFDDEPRAFVAPAGGRGTERTIIRAVFDLQPRLAEPDFASVFTLARARVQRRSLVVLFTQVLEPVAAARLGVLLRGLLPRHLPLCVLLRDRDVDRLARDAPASARDLYVHAAAAEAIVWREQLVRDLRKAGVLVIDAYPEQVTPALLRRYAEIKARRLL